MVYLISKKETVYENIGRCSVEFCLDYFKDHKEVQLDTETMGYDPHTGSLLCFQLGDYENQFVIDCTSIDLMLFKPFLESDRVFILHNAKFDLRFFLHNRIIITNVYDTYLAECVLHAGDNTVRKSLGEVAYKYLEVELDKDIRGFINFEGLSERVINYAAEDVKYLSAIKDIQYVKLVELDLTAALELDNLFVCVLAYVEYCGLYFDKEKWEVRIQKDIEKQNEVRAILNKFILDNRIERFMNLNYSIWNEGLDVTINWDSPKQVIDLFKSLGIDVMTKDKITGKLKESCEETVLAHQVEKFSILKPYLEYKGLEKRISTYGLNFIRQINPVTGRLHTQFKQILDTGRLSSGGKDKSNKVEYINFLNIPRDHDIRDCFVPQTEDNILVDADYSSQEIVVFTNFSKDPNLIKLFKDGLGDLHSYTAWHVFPEIRKAVPELTKESIKKIKDLFPEQRYVSKTGNFAIQYGGVGSTIARNCNISLEEGERFYNRYFQTFTGVKKYFDTCKFKALQHGYVTFNNVTRRKAFIVFYDNYMKMYNKIDSDFWTEYRTHKELNTQFFEDTLKPMVREFFRMRGNIERMALNYPIQGTSADITKLAAYFFYQWLVKEGLLFKILIPNIIHDEIFLECPKELADSAKENLLKCMKHAGTFFCDTIPLDASCEITNVWKH